MLDSIGQRRAPSAQNTKPSTVARNPRCTHRALSRRHSTRQWFATDRRGIITQKLTHPQYKSNTPKTPSSARQGRRNNMRDCGGAEQRKPKKGCVRCTKKARSFRSLGGFLRIRITHLKGRDKRQAWRIHNDVRPNSKFILPPYRQTYRVTPQKAFTVTTTNVMRVYLRQQNRLTFDGDLNTSQ